VADVLTHVAREFGDAERVRQARRPAEPVDVGDLGFA
jgi:hypothetical protein